MTVSMGSIPKDKLPAGWLSPELGALLSIPVLDSLPDNPTKFTAPYVLIEAEIPARGHNLQDFHGCEIAKNLRVKHGYLGPIIIVSCLPKEHFLDQVKSRNDYRILLGRGTGFLDLHDIGNPERINAVMEGVKPLTPATLADLNTSLLSLYGYLRSRIGHDLRWDQPLAERTAIVDEVRGQLTAHEASSLFTGNRLSVLLDRDPNPTDFGATANDIANKIRELDPEQSQRLEKRTWRPKIILLEDDDRLREQYESKLTETFDVFPTATARAAKDLIDEDEKNEIYCLLSDWRLYADPKAAPERREWQELQGYEVLSYAASKRHIALFALTSLSEHHVHEIRNQLGVDIWLQKKEHLQGDGAWASFIDLLFDGCQRKLEVVCNQPTGARWRNAKGQIPDEDRGGAKAKAQGNEDRGVKYPDRSFFDRYRDARNSSKWVQFEREISERSNEIWLKHYQPMEGQTWLGIELKSYTAITSVKLSMRELALEDLLVYRRIYLALRCSHGRSAGIPTYAHYPNKKTHPAWDVMCIIRGETPESLLEGDESRSLKPEASQYAHHGCFNGSKITNGQGSGILPEETAWLIRNGFDLPDSDEEEDEAPVPPKKRSTSKAVTSSTKQVSKMTDHERAEAAALKNEARMRSGGLP